MKQVPIWKGGLGSIELLTVARNEGEAINNLVEKEPILAAIGCHVEPFAPVDGCEVVALVPDKFVYGDERRDKEEKARKAAEAKHEKAIKEAQEAEEQKIKEIHERALKEKEEAEEKIRLEQLKAIDEAAGEPIITGEPETETDIVEDTTGETDIVEDIIDDIVG